MGWLLLPSPKGVCAFIVGNLNPDGTLFDETATAERFGLEISSGVGGSAERQKRKYS